VCHFSLLCFTFFSVAVYCFRLHSTRQHLAVGVSHGLTHLCCASMAERIEVLLGVETLDNLKHCIGLGGPNFLRGFDEAFATRSTLATF